MILLWQGIHVQYPKGFGSTFPELLKQMRKFPLNERTIFKKRTKKIFSSFLNEIRIGYACKLIQEEHHPVTEAAYLSGYNSPSHFYKQFKLIKGVSPSNFYLNTKEEL